LRFEYTLIVPALMKMDVGALVSWTKTLTGILPRSLVVLAAEISGVCPVQGVDPAGLAPGITRRGWRWVSRLGGLVYKGNHISPDSLFDARYYLDSHPDVRSRRWPPLLHFLLWGGFEGRKPHPLFDPEWYIDQYPDVAAIKLNPLQHYVRFGYREGRSPHPLFDAAWYLHRYPEVKARGWNPLVHFLRCGGPEGLQPHPLFDSPWYARQYADVIPPGMNPLVHYVESGGALGLNPNRHFNTEQYARHYPAIEVRVLNPLIHYVTCGERGFYDPHPGYPRASRRRGEPSPVTTPSAPLVLHGRRPRQPSRIWQNSIVGSTLPVFVVYGNSNVNFMESSLIPAFAAQDSRLKFHLHVVNYRDARPLLSPALLGASTGAVEAVTDWSADRESRHIGFGEAVNWLFRRVAPESCFLLANPDAMPMPGCVERLLDTFCESNGALVEARQWPSEHPKEYDLATGQTPWASGAFVLIASEAFRQLDGFDPLYFLYNEDVDLSWRAWLHDMPVIYERRAACAHFTGLLSYRDSRLYYEQFFSLRNFLLISYKFFGGRGEQAARQYIESAGLPAVVRETIEASYSKVRHEVRCIETQEAYYADKIKILGLNQYHELRRR
jgi:hypothetical protein